MHQTVHIKWTQSSQSSRVLQSSIYFCAIKSAFSLVTNISSNMSFSRLRLSDSISPAELKERSIEDDVAGISFIVQ